MHHQLVRGHLGDPAGQTAFPLFASSAPIKWARPGGPFDPHSGSWDVYSGIADVSWKRLSKTVDLTGKSSGDLSFWTSYDTEAGWDHLVVEARTAGGDDWTTLPDANGHTTQATGDSCAAELAHHPPVHPALPGAELRADRQLRRRGTRPRATPRAGSSGRST